MAFETASVILIVALQFFLVYFASTLNSRNKDGDAVPINTWIKTLLYSFALFIAFISTQMAVAISDANNYAAQIQGNFDIIYHLGIWIFIFIGMLLIYGTLFNSLVGAYNWVGKKFTERKFKR